jgi:[protein-PII] uridylyltransferase
MSRVAQKEDLSDPEVIESFARHVKDPRRLTGLYLLTVSDIRGTSPKVWNAWKGKLLEDLFRADAARPGRRQAEHGRRDRAAQAGGPPDAGAALHAAGH